MSCKFNVPERSELMAVLQHAPVDLALASELIARDQELLHALSQMAEKSFHDCVPLPIRIVSIGVDALLHFLNETTNYPQVSERAPS